MNDPKKPNEPMTARTALEEAQQRINRADPAHYLPVDPFAAEREKEAKLDKLKAQPLDQLEEALRHLPGQNQPGATEDFGQSQAKQMEQLSQIQAAQSEQLDERIRRIVREEIQIWAERLVWENRQQDKGG